MKECLVQLHTEPFTVQREWTVDDIPVLTAVVSLPQPVPDKGRVPSRIRRYYQLQSRAFLRYCEGWLLPQAAAEYRAALESSRPLPCFHAELSYQVTYNQDGFWSLYTQSRETGPAGPALLTRRGDTWDLSVGYPVPLQDFFPKGGRWKKELLRTSEAEILRQEAAGVARYHENWRRRLRQSFNAQNYYLTADGLTWFYPMHAIGPAAEGIPAFLMPFGPQGPKQPGRETAPPET